MANATTLIGTPITTAVATDPDLCRVSGYLKNAHGQALSGWAFVLRYCYIPTGLSPDTLILQERIPVKADAAGYVEFDLIRGAKLTVELPNLLPWLYKEVTVPDASSADLLTFLFPYLVSVEFIDPTARSIAVGDTMNALLEGTLSNGEVVAVPGSSVTYDNSDTAVLSPGPTAGYFRGLSSGSVTLTVTAVDRSSVDENEDRNDEPLVFFDIPDVVLPASPLSVTVS